MELAVGLMSLKAPVVAYAPISLWTCWGIPMMVVLRLFFLMLLSGLFTISVLFRGLKVEASREAEWWKSVY